MANPKIPHKDAERHLTHYLERWIYLLGLGAWKIEWNITEEEPVEEGVKCLAKTLPLNYTKKTAYIQFWKGGLISPAAIEKLVVHELLHCFDKHLWQGGGSHTLIQRLEPILRRIRQRASRRA